MDIPIGIRPKVEKARQDFDEAVEEIVAKKRRQLRNPRPLSSNGVCTSLSPISTPTGSANNVLDFEADAERLPVAKRVVTVERATKELHGETGGLSVRQVNEIALLNMPLRTKAGDDKMRRRMLKKTKSMQDIDLPTSSLDRVDKGELPTMVLGFTNLGNTCYFNACMQALLTATYYFPEHTHIEEVLETTNTPVTTTFTYVDLE